MHLNKKYILAASLCLASSHLHAVGEVPNVIAGALFGAGYKKIFQSTSTVAAIPLTALTIVAELIATAAITSIAFKEDRWYLQKRRDAIWRNFLLIYGSSIASAIALNEYEKYTARSDEIEPLQKSK